MILNELNAQLSNSQLVAKRIFDIVFSFLGLLFFGWLIFISWMVATFDLRSNGLFKQKRVGMNGKPFNVIKIKTMRDISNISTTVTCSHDPRITKIGSILRSTKIDELPQLWNILVGEMSFVGPRPDVPGFADTLVGEERAMLSIRPGITGPATLKYRNEEELLSKQADPETFNREVIWPDKVRINLEYIRSWSLRRDIKYIFDTVLH